MSTFVTTGYVLRVIPWREYDRLYTVLTADHGKLQLVAAGTRKLSSKLSPHLQPFSEVEFMVANGRARGRLASAVVRDVLVPERVREPATVALGQVFLEVADVMTREGQPEQELVDVLRESLVSLRDLPDSKEAWRQAAHALLADYLIRVLKAGGLAVRLTHCEHCHRELSEPTVFSWTDHSFLHAEHAAPSDTIVKLEPQVLRWLQSAVDGAAQLPEPLPPPALTFLLDLISGHANKSLSTVKVLRSIL
jgi:DNA repair protein RecO (recombination protein O)